MKRIIAFGLALTLLVSNMTLTFANVQLAVSDLNIDNVYYVIGENVVTGEPIINPTMTISWIDPAAWAGDIDVHSPDYYEVVVKNVSTGTTNTVRVNSGTAAFTSKKLDLHNELNLKTGSFYDISIQPYHSHVTTVNGVATYTLAPSSQPAKKAYGITDMQVDFISNEDSIQVIWDDLGVSEFQYRIVYALGDYSNKSKQELVNNKVGELTGLSINSEGVTSFYDPISKRNKLSYTIKQNIYPGQVYSVMVEPTAEYYAGDVIVRNRNYPYIKSVSTNVELSLVEEGDYIRLQWEIPASFKVGQTQEEYALVEATLKEYQGGTSRNLAIFDGTAASIGYFRLKKPIYETEYELKLTYKAVANTSKPAIEPISNKLKYVPSEYLIKPTKPYVPKVISQNIISDLKSTYTTDQIQQILVDNYYVPGYTDTGNIDDLINKNVTYHVDTYNTSINYTWGAFQRIDINVASPTYGQYIYDTNIYYDIWVTDEMSTLAYATPVAKDLRYNSSTDSHAILNTANNIIGYRQQINFYYDTIKKEITDIKPNEIYYIKIQAKKVTAQGTLISEPSISTIYYTYGGDAYEPPTIAKPPLKVKESETTVKGITINWKENWYEAIATDLVSPHPLATWQHEVWVDNTGTVYTTQRDNTTYFPLYKSAAEVVKLNTYINTFYPANIISRKVDLGTDDFGVSDVKYKFLKIPYQTVLNLIKERQKVDPTFSFADYYNELVENDKNGTKPLAWNKIIPYSDTTDNTYLAYRENGLLPNMSYLFILYPYRELFTSEILYAHYPTPIIVSTSPETVVVTPDPTVPSIYVTNKTDSTITTTWKYNTDFTYELMYSRTEDVSKAKPVPITLPTNILDSAYPKSGAYFDVVVKDLFPSTRYYFWVRAKQTSNSKVSLWSNPVIGQTLDAAAPIPPRGVGIAPLSRIDDYSYDLSVTEDYLIVDWIKDLGDVTVADSAKVKRSYSYILEIADNPKFIDPQYIESSGGTGDVVPTNVEILEKNLVKINGLIPNRQYYVRMKTRLTIKGSEQGQLIVKDSVSYSIPIRIITLSTGGEYDGYNDPSLSVLPSEDYELVYSGDDQTLEFRFRDDEKDSTGASDNNVDQRLISQLIENKIRTYVIDVSTFGDKRITNRKVTIPYSIMEAFNTYQVKLQVVTGDMTIEVPASALMKAITKQVKSFGVAPSLIMDISTLDAYYTQGQMPETALMTIASPQEVSMFVKSDRKTEKINYTDQAMTIALKTTSRYALYNKDTALYVRDANAIWSKNKTNTYDTKAGVMKFQTADVGSYGLYVVDRPLTVAGGSVTPTHWSESSRKDVYSQFVVTGLKNYNANGKATEKNVVQAVYGSIIEADAINLADSMTAQDMKTLYRSGVKGNESQSKTTMTREEVISMFVRAYEIRNQVVVPVDSSLVSQIKKDPKISSSYYNSLAKASKIGMISNVKAIRGKDAITYGEFFTIWSKALD